MNKKKWTQRPHTGGEFFAKLIEEVGEVAREITNEYDGQDEHLSAIRLCEELRHVEFIAKTWRQAIQEQSLQIP